jgi:EpsI family protein
MISKIRILIILALFGCTWYLLQITSAVQAIPIKKSLEQFPTQIGAYHLADSFQSSSEVLKLLGVDDYIQYNYIDDQNHRINLYVGYYRAVGVTGSYHSPKNCLPGGGWGIDTVNEVKLPSQATSGGEDVSQMLIRNGNDYQIVLYWYQNRGRIIASEYWEKIYLVLDALLKGRRDGAFVRIMTVADDGNIDDAAKRVQVFGGEVKVMLEQFLPGAQL